MNKKDVILAIKAKIKSMPNERNYERGRLQIAMESIEELMDDGEFTVGTDEDIKAQVVYLPVDGEPETGDMCLHPKYGIGILRGVNKHMGTFRWDAMWTMDPSYPRTLKDEISFDLSERDTVLKKLEPFACEVDEEDEEDEASNEPVVIAKMEWRPKKWGYKQPVEGEVIDGEFRVKCKSCGKL